LLNYWPTDARAAAQVSEGIGAANAENWLEEIAEVLDCSPHGQIRIGARAEGVA